MAIALHLRDDTSPAAARPAKRRRRWMILTSSLLALGVLWMAPTIVAKTPLRQWVVAMLVEDLDGTATARSMSLGWFSPATFNEVELLDASDQPVLTATKISGDRSLWALLRDRSDLGTIRVEGAKIHLALRPDGSNLEDVLRPLLESDESTPGPIQLRVEVVDATIAIEPTDDGRRWQIERLNAQVDLSDGLSDGDGGQKVSVTASGVIPDRHATGRFALGVQLTSAAGDDLSIVTEGSVKLKTDALPVEMFQSLLSRFLPQTELAGRLDSNVEVRWNMASSPSVEITGRFDVDDLRIAAPWLGDDILRLRRLEIPCDVVYRDGRVDLRQLEIACDVGRLTLGGSTRLDRFDTAGLYGLLLAETYQLDGQIDLARLAQILPSTLRIKAGTTITGGHVRFGLSRRGEDGQIHYEGHLRAKNLSADGPDGRILWRQPIDVSFSVRENAAETVVERLQCRSDFLVIQANGRLDNLTASVDFDLQKLVEQISQIVDVGDLQLAGRGRGQLHVRRSSKTDFTAGGRIDVDRFRFAASQTAAAPQRSWSEDRITVTLDAAGEVTGGRPTRLHSATATATIGDERFVVRLATPVANVGTQTNWPLQLQLTTRLAAWLPRLEPWLSLPVNSAQGDCRLTAALDVSSAGVLIRESHLQIDRLRVMTEGLQIVEPHVELQLAGRWDFVSGDIEVHSGGLKSGALSVTSEGFSIDRDEAGRWQLAGGIQFQADAARLLKWFGGNRQAPEAYDLAGRLSGEVKLAGGDGSTSAELEIVAEDIVLARWQQTAWGAAPLAVRPTSTTRGEAPAAPKVNHLRRPPLTAQTLWREPKAVLRIAGRYDPTSDVLEIKSVELVGSALNLTAAGKVSALASRRQLELRGQLDYDWSKLSDILKIYTGSGVSIAGHNTGTFALAGPLAATEAAPSDGSPSDQPKRSWLESFSANAQLGWRQIDVFGLKAEQGTLQVKLSGGEISIGPLDLKVNQGRVTAAPKVQLTGKRALLILAKGPLARDVVLTKEVCAGGLKFIVPMLADAVEAEGRFSIDLDGASVPLAAPAESHLSGRLTVHSIELTPGPLTGQFLALAGQLELIFRGGGLAGRAADTKVTMRENQQIIFRMANGRIYHQGLELTAAGAVIRTSGSVGIDETLDLVVELPIQEKWIGRDTRLAPWRNRVVRIPIRGTLSRPKVDTRVLGDVAAQIARQAGQRFLQDQFNKGLEKLLRPRGEKQ